MFISYGWIIYNEKQNNNRKRDDDDDDDGEWIWNDQALTFRPRKAKYDSTCACVFEKYDHTCPWTGTAIAKNNIVPFRIFVMLVVVMLLFNIVLLTLPNL